MMVYLQLFIIFFKVGLFGFGGGYAILPMIYQDVQAFGFITADDFSNLVALSQVTPGPIAINAATYVGFKTAGLAGAIIATIAVSMPSFILLMIAVAFIGKFKHNRTVKSILNGIRPATVGLMASAFIFMFQTAILTSNGTEDKQMSFSDILNSIDMVGLSIFLITYLLIRLHRFGPMMLTLFGALMGIILGVTFEGFQI